MNTLFGINLKYVPVKVFSGMHQILFNQNPFTTLGFDDINVSDGIALIIKSDFTGQSYLL